MPAAVDLPSFRSRPSFPKPTPQSAPVDLRRVRLFFPLATGESLKELERQIPLRPNFADAVRAVLRELASNVPGARGPIPPATEIRQVFLDSFGILYLDFSKEFLAATAPPAPWPELAISAIVNSLTANFREVKRVQFLVEGKEVPSMAGSWDLRRPVNPNFPGEETPPSGSRS